MSDFRIPSKEKKIIQSNVGDYAGNVYETYNIDLDSNPGTLKASKRLSRILDTNTPNWADNEFVQAFSIHSGNYYIATTDNVFECSVNNDPTLVANWADITTLGLEDTGFETDMESFDGKLIISLGTDIMTWDGSTKDDNWWTTTISGTALTTAKTHTLKVLRTGKDTIFVTDGNIVRYYNSTAGHTAITLDTNMTSHVLVPSLDKMWVGTYTEVENNAYMYEIAVGNDQPSQAYEVEGRTIFTGWTYKNTPFIITDRGYIQTFNGAGFETVAQFPWANDSKAMEGSRPGLVQDSAVSRAIHPKGAQVSGKYVYIKVNTDDEYAGNSLISKRAPSGVWVLDLETYSLTHRYSLTETSGDYGSWKVDRSGPILITNTPETRIMVGGSVNNIEGVWMEGTVTPQASFTSIRHESDTIADSFSTFVVKADTLDTDETIDVFYKDAHAPGFPLEVNDVTWLNETQFTTAEALTTNEVGYLVSFVSGAHAGYYATIENVEGGTTKTITIDKSLGVLNETSTALIDSFKALSDQYTEADGEYKRIGSPETSTNRQYKVVMKGNVTVRETISKSNSKVEL